MYGNKFLFVTLPSFEKKSTDCNKNDKIWTLPQKKADSIFVVDSEQLRQKMQFFKLSGSSDKSLS